MPDLGPIGAARRAAAEREQRAADTCRPVEVDGETIRVRGAQEMTDEDRAAFAEVVRAAKRKYAAEHPPRHTVDTITSDALDALYAERDRLRAELDRLYRSRDSADALRYAFPAIDEPKET
ncbi:hypothetical protein [Streptomyces marianii]|uniref:Uncharacterized protein n=1 Tax=Streptomyces marianii TaxID=1817406 RepID=A0A5R9E192_9ACTN|nr:hypothetical protein [Streptomyces marianii]TLQ43466.1 hypothetical protein FEF34_10200 [Streptomyces marianii]